MLSHKEKIMNRFGTQTIKGKGLKFDYDLGDVLLCKDGIPKLITNFGIYDNQYWTESYYPDGIHLGAGNYTNIKDIISKSKDIVQIKIIITSYIKEIESNYNKFFSDVPKEIKKIKIHLKFYKKLLDRLEKEK